MRDAALRDDAVKHLEATTISYPAWKARNYTPEQLVKTEWFKALAALSLIDPPPPPNVLPAYDLTITPNYNNGSNPDDVKHNLNAWWVWGNSAQTYAPPNGSDPFRTLLLDPRSKDADGKQGCDEWWFVIQRCWPKAYNPAVHGQFCTQANFHNVATHDGPDGGVGWGFGSGVSALLLGWEPQDATPSVRLEYADPPANVIALPMPSRDVMHVYEIRFVAGRVDGSTVRPGEIEVRADGVTVAHFVGLNTIQSAKAPDGKTYVQRWIACDWDGDYTQNLQAPATTRFTQTRAGVTLDAAWSDRPFVVSGTDKVTGQVWNGKAPNVGPPTLKELP